MRPSLLAILLAVVILITGFGKAVSVVKETRPAKARLASKQKRLLQLRELARGGTPSFDADGLKRTGLSSPAPFRKLVSVYLEGHEASVQDQADTPLSPEHPSWQVRRSELRVTELPWPALARFLHKAGSQPHPWRLAGYKLKPGTKGATGTLTFETLANKP